MRQMMRKGKGERDAAKVPLTATAAAAEAAPLLLHRLLI